MSLRRIYASIVRHMFTFRHSWDRLTDAFYWPGMDVVIWGLTISAIEAQGGAKASNYYISMIIFAVILWYVLWRAQIDITVSLLEELWSENLGNLFTSPLTRTEWTLSFLIIGMLKLIITLTFTSLLGFALYKVSILTLGWPLLFFIVSLLLFGWAYGLFVAGLFLRFGTQIQTFAWAGGFALMPFSAVYYPLSSLPVPIQTIGKLLPSMYVFEGMRTVLQTGVLPIEYMTTSLLLNGIYLFLGIVFFYVSFNDAHTKGLNHVK